MRRAVLICLFAAWAAVVMLPTAAHSQSPDIQRHYRFIPSRSIVHVTGGFAGFDWPMHVKGHFDFLTRFEEPGPLTVMPSAKFVDVEAELFRPSPVWPNPDPVWDLDDTLNLSGLHGIGNYQNQFLFRGEEGQGWPIELKVTRRGSLLHIMGANKPACCDFFNYEIRALAIGGPYADFDLDGKIGKADMNVLMANLGTASGALFDDGDADGDGDVDGDDFSSSIGPDPRRAKCLSRQR